MPNPTSSDVHVNAPLTQIAVNYMQNPAGFVADKVFPNIPVQKQSDRYFRYDRSDAWRDQFRDRAPGTESAGGGWKIDSTPTYFAGKKALHKDIDDDTRANSDAPINMDRDATTWLAQQGLINREVAFAAKYFTTGVWTGIDGTNGDLTGIAGAPGANQFKQWNDAASTPVLDITTQMDNVGGLTGYRPNKFTMGRQVWTQLKDNADFLSRIQYGGTTGNGNPAVVSKMAVAQVLEIEEVMVMDGIYATSPENPNFETNLTTAYIAGKNALLVYAAPAASLMQPSGGYTFSWVGYLGAGSMGQRIKAFRVETIASDRVEAEMAYAQEIVASDCGVYFATAVA